MIALGPPLREVRPIWAIFIFRNNRNTAALLLC